MNVNKPIFDSFLILGIIVASIFSSSKVTAYEGNKKAMALSNFCIEWGNIVVETNGIDVFTQQVDNITISIINKILTRTGDDQLRRELNHFENEIMNLIRLNGPNILIKRNPYKHNVVHQRIKYPSLNIGTDDMILAIFQYWNIIRYFYPHYEHIKQSWTQILPDLILRILNDNSKGNYCMIISEMAAMTNDGHAQIKCFEMDKFWGYYYIPMETYLFNQRIFIKNHDLDIDLPDPNKCCIELFAINGITFEDWFCSNQKLIPGANLRTKLNIGSGLFLRRVDPSECSILVKIKNDKLTIKINPFN